MPKASAPASRVLLDPSGDPIPSTRPSEDPAALLKPDDPATSMFERLARDPSVDVAKLKELLAMHERVLASQAKAAFDAAYSEMQGEIPVIDEQGQILVQGEVRSTYARNEDIQPIIKPILKKYGFALRFRNETLADGRLKITGILSHRSGHSEQDEFVTLPDSGGRMNDIQRLGSARSYGQRYTTIALLNIATALEDDDGEKAGQAEVPAVPVGFDDFVTDLWAVADEGTAALEAAWAEAKKDFKTYLVKTDRQRWEKIKIRAARAEPQARR